LIARPMIGSALVNALIAALPSAGE